MILTLVSCIIFPGEFLEAVDLIQGENRVDVSLPLPTTVLHSSSLGIHLQPWLVEVFPPVSFVKKN